MNLNKRIKLDRSFELAEDSAKPDITGTIVGLGHIVGITVYIVELDQGFYSPDRRIYISRMVVARESLRPIE